MEPLLELLRSQTDTDSHHTETAHEAAKQQIPTLDRQHLIEVRAGLERSLARARTDAALRTRIELLKAKVDIQLATTQAPTTLTAASTLANDGLNAIIHTGQGANTLLQRGAELIPAPARTVGILATGAAALYAVPRFFRKLFTGRWTAETPEAQAKREAQEKERKSKIEAAGGTYTPQATGPSVLRRAFAGIGTMAAGIAGLFALNHLGRNSANTPSSTPTV